MSESYHTVLAKQVLDLEQVRTGFRANIDPELTELVGKRLTWTLMRFSGMDPFNRMDPSAARRLMGIIDQAEPTTISQSKPMPSLREGGGGGTAPIVIR